MNNTLKTPVEIIKRLDIYHWRKNKKIIDVEEVTAILGDIEGTIRLIDSTRPPPVYAKTKGNNVAYREGDHTVAISAVLRPLEWLLCNVTPEEALKRVGTTYIENFKLAFIISDEFQDAGHLTELWKLVNGTHLEMMKYSSSSPTVFCPLLSNYLTYLVYLHNFLPLASVRDRQSIPGFEGNKRREGIALSDLEKFEKSQSKNLDTAIASLAQLFDEKAIEVQFDRKKQESYASTWTGVNRKEQSMGPLHFSHHVIAFQILGLFRILKALPRTRRIFFDDGFFYYSPDDEANKNCVENITKVIFSSIETIALKKDWKQYNERVVIALTLIREMRRKMIQDPFYPHSRNL